MDEEEYMAGEPKKPDPITKLRAELDQVTCAAVEVAEAIGKFYAQCILNGLPHDLSSALAVTLYHQLMNPGDK